MCVDFVLRSFGQRGDVLREGHLEVVDCGLESSAVGVGRVVAVTEVDGKDGYKLVHPVTSIEKTLKKRFPELSG